MSGSRLADLLCGLSLATDLAVGVPLETSLRTSLVATRLGHVLGCEPAVRRDAYYAALLRHLGCTAWAHEAAAIQGGDDRDVIHAFEGVDRSSRVAMLRRIGELASGEPVRRRARAIAGVIAAPRAGLALTTAQCAQATALAIDLELGDGVVTALGQIYERHDGRGTPRGLRGDQIATVAQLVVAAQLVEVLHRRLGRAGALAELARRRGRELSARVVDAAIDHAPQLWPLLEQATAEQFLEAEPEPRVAIGPERLATIALGFARFVDLKTPSTIGHSPAVAALAVAAARIAGCSASDTAALRIAGLLHDLGAVSVANGVWEHPGPLGIAGWEQVRLHAYHTERILARSAITAPLAAIAASHHERIDGGGYHRGARGEALAKPARILAAADAFVALREDRPHRPAFDDRGAARVLSDDARAGKLCREAVAAVLEAAGHARARVPLPAELTDREAEVLRQLARGLPTKAIAARLAIAPRTVKHHIEHIYAKTGVTTRAAAALFAARHDLVAPDRPNDP